MQNTIKRLQKIDSLLSQITKLYNITGLYPRNIEQEKKKFLTNNNYNPQFEYEKKDINYDKAIKIINKIKYKETVMDDLFKEKAQEIKNNLLMFKNIGNEDEFTKYSIKIYGEPDKNLVKKACDITLKKIKRTNIPKKLLSSKKAIEEFRKIFLQLNLKWRVIEKDIASNALVIPSKRTFVIKKDAFFSKKTIKRFIVHEIYAHVLRTEFGLRQPYKVFSTGLANYEATEEGLALYKEKKAKVMDKNILQAYAHRVLAVNKALKSDFSQTFHFIKKYIPEDEKAWDLTVRVKRGLKDTSKKGSFTKDYIYLLGFFEVSEFIKNQSGLHLLHYGKINTKQALLIPSIEGLKNPFIVLKSHFKKHIHEISILY
jgi:uncharacterized protein (TIGR02421 family)